MEFGEFIDDLVVYWRIEDVVDFAGTGGWCASREGSALPYVGQVTIDPEDGLSRRVYVHELAHALGFTAGTWERLELIADPTPESAKPPVPDTHFTGRQAIQEFDSAGGDRYDGAKVPLANDVSIGGLNSHWRASVFGCELMSYGRCDGNESPVSRITLAAFADMGYRVNYSFADTYRLPSASAGAAAARGVQAHDDVLDEPVVVELDVSDEVRRILTGE